ncbi:hypothetical protein ACFVWG_12660 [Kribbella sp. NPDC058245]|uniref:hypothetical protein n=1 Tax=Kribbella sp. NPDC058245 TaxID=3346399 RepID=UPI0036EF2086
MNEEDFNEALHDVMTRSSPPPSMDPARALEQGRRARKRRRTVWAGAALVTLVVGAGVGPALVANYAVGQSGGEPPVSGPGATSTLVPTTRKSGDPWPDGQVDRTASAGPHADQAVTLMDDLSSSVPAGFTTPNLTYPDGRAMRWPQGQYASSDGEQDYWEYQATIPVQKDNLVGQLFVQSTTPDGKAATSPCKLAQRFWGGTGTCSIVDVAGKKVGVLTTKGKGSYDQWAAYRHDDGTVVYLAQAKQSGDEKRPPLKQPVFTAQQLAELVTSPKFKIST